MASKADIPREPIAWSRTSRRRAPAQGRRPVGRKARLPVAGAQTARAYAVREVDDVERTNIGLELDRGRTIPRAGAESVEW